MSPSLTGHSLVQTDNDNVCTVINTNFSNCPTLIREILSRSTQNLCFTKGNVACCISSGLYEASLLAPFSYDGS